MYTGISGDLAKPKCEKFCTCRERHGVRANYRRRGRKGFNCDQGASLDKSVCASRSLPWRHLHHSTAALWSEPVSVQEIEKAVTQLSPSELAVFRQWFAQCDKDGVGSAVTELEQALLERLAGPFEPLEGDWKQRVRQAAVGSGET